MGKITYSDVSRRTRMLQVTGPDDIVESCKILHDRYVSNKSVDSAKAFMKECTLDTKMANLWFSDLVECAKTYNDSNVQRIFVEQILPMIDSSVSTDFLSQDAPKEWSDTFTNNVECDRINANHQIISKKLDVDKYCGEHYKQINANMLADLCCDTVSRYKKLDTVAKLNIAVEEFCIIADKYQIPYVENAIVDRISRFIIMAEHVSTGDTKLLEMADSLSKNVLIDYNPGKSDPVLEGFLYSDKRSTASLKDAVKAYIKESKFDEAFELIESVILGYRKVDEASDKIAHSVMVVVEDVIPYIATAIEETWLDTQRAGERLESVFATLSGHMISARKYSQDFPLTESDGEDNTPARFGAYADLLEKLKESIDFYLDMVYHNNNVKTIKETAAVHCHLNEGIISGALSGLFKSIGKVKNWISQKIDGAGNLRVKRKGIRRVKSRIFGEDTVLTEVMTPDGKLDAVVESFRIMNGEVDSSIHTIFEEMCTQINGILTTDNVKCYYTATNNLIEIHITSEEKYNISEEDYSEYIEHDISLDDADSVYEMMRYASLEEAANIQAHDIADFFIAHEDYAMNDFGTFLELASFATLDKDCIQEAYQEIGDFSGFDFRNKWSFAVERYAPALDLNTEFVLESLDVLYALVTEQKMDTAARAKMLKTRKENQNHPATTPQSTQTEKPEQKQDEKDTNESVASLLGLEEAMDSATKAKMKRTREENKRKAERQADTKAEPKSKKSDDDGDEKVLDFNNVKLFLLGIKDKMKSLGAKEQKFCRDLDNNAERLVESMKKALVSDRREAIIKGSIIPSFSKSIKVGVALAGTAIVNPLAAVIAAVGAFAMSKKLTKKERVLLLDDIEIELQILEKEIQNAENSNKMKKMRYLMKERKNLQRQYARIKYNIRVGKDLIPGAATSGGDV